MSKNKIKSFTLPELLVVMIITAIIVGLAFSVLRLVQKQIYTIQTNFEKTNNLILFEQRLWQDFNELNTIQCNREERSLLMESEIDTVRYAFNENYILRNKDTIKLKIILNKFLFEGKEVQKGNIDALMISGKLELPNYQIFISKKNDITLFMNKEDGF
jgi:prepilin-type N-terminal cleavage/methylation domain-containing protein